MPPKKPVEINAKPLKCLVCGHGLFVKRRGDVVSAIDILSQLDFGEQPVVCYVCAECGHIHWFAMPK